MYVSMYVYVCVDVFMYIYTFSMYVYTSSEQNFCGQKGLIDERGESRRPDPFKNEVIIGVDHT